MFLSVVNQCSRSTFLLKISLPRLLLCSFTASVHEELRTNDINFIHLMVTYIIMNLLWAQAKSSRHSSSLELESPTPFYDNSMESNMR